MELVINWFFNGLDFVKLFWFLQSELWQVKGKSVGLTQLGKQHDNMWKVGV